MSPGHVVSPGCKSVLAALAVTGLPRALVQRASPHGLWCSSILVCPGQGLEGDQESTRAGLSFPSSLLSPDLVRFKREQAGGHG